MSSWMINGLNQGVYSVIQSPMNTFTENSLSHQTSSVTNVLPSPVRMASAGKQVGFYDSNNNSLDEMNFGNQRIPTFHPHSFPEYHDSLAHGIPCNSSTTLADLTSMGLRMTEGMDSRHFHGASTTRHAVEHKVGGKFSLLFVVCCLLVSFTFLLVMFDLSSKAQSKLLTSYSSVPCLNPSKISTKFVYYI